MFRDAVFISVTIPRGGESFPGCQRPFPAAGFHCDLLFEVALQAFGQQQVMGFELGIDGARNALGQEGR